MDRNHPSFGRHRVDLPRSVRRRRLLSARTVAMMRMRRLPVVSATLGLTMFMSAGLAVIAIASYAAARL